MSKIEQIKKFEELQLIFDISKDEILGYKPKFINPADIKKPTSINKKVEVSVRQENVIKTIASEENPLVLVFASAKNPGGGVTQGSIAQEEVISLHSSWYFQLIDNPQIIKDFYLPKGANAINTDNMLYLESSFLLTDEYHNMISPKKVSFLGATAPNLKGMVNQGLKCDENMVYNIFSQRIKNVLNFAMSAPNEILIVGAWGCGVFGLSPKITAQLFKENIQSTGFNKKVIFSIVDEKTKNIFSDVL